MCRDACRIFFSGWVGGWVGTFFFYIQFLFLFLDVEHSGNSVKIKRKC